MTAQAADSVMSFETPATLAEATRLKASLGDGALFVAGATDLGVQLRRGLQAPEHLISLAGIGELGVLDGSGDELIVGGGVRHRDLERSELLAGPLQALREACRTVGSVQTRNVGTIGGNLANASPAADTPPVLVAFRASLDLVGPDGERTVPIDAFFTGYRRTVLAPTEVIARVRMPIGGPGTGSVFLKLGRRAAMEISIACVGVCLETADDGTVTRAGIGLGSVAPTTVRAARAEALLEGAEPTPGRLAEAATAALEDCDPIDDVRATAGYRRAAVPVLVGRALRIAVDRIERTR